MSTGVTEEELDAAIASRTMSRDDFAEADRIAAEEADWIAQGELERFLKLIEPGA